MLHCLSNHSFKRLQNNMKLVLANSLLTAFYKQSIVFSILELKGLTTRCCWFSVAVMCAFLTA